jgi:hypothetical protein
MNTLGMALQHTEEGRQLWRELNDPARSWAELCEAWLDLERLFAQSGGPRAELFVETPDPHSIHSTITIPQLLEDEDVAEIWLHPPRR